MTSPQGEIKRLEVKSLLVMQNSSAARHFESRFDGRHLIAVAAWLTIIVPIGVDGLLMARGHMNNPAWLPHAKLHCAMSFFAAMSLGAVSLALLKVRPATDSMCMAIAAFAATAFWAGLIGAGQWPGASYNFQNDPAIYRASPVLGGVPIDLNVVVAALSIVIGWWGFYQTQRSARREERRQTQD